jgi:hypothetical protein
MDSVYAHGGVTSNEDVLRNFCTNSSEVKANNLSTHYDSYNDEVLLRQYGTLIAKRKGDKVMITAKRYSVTTSKVQNELLRLAMEYGLDVQKTNEFAKGGMSRKCEVGDNVFVKSKGLSGLVSRVNGENCYVKFPGNLSKHDGNYNTNDLKIEESSLFMDEYAKGGSVVKKPSQSELNNMTAFNLIDAMKSDKKNYELYKKQLLKLYPDAKGFAKGGKVEISHYKVGDNVFMDFMDAADYCDKHGLSYDEIVKTKKYAKGGKVEISHYKVGDNVFMDFMDAADYCDAHGLSYDEIVKTKKYAEGGDIAQGNYEMMLSQAKEVEHHVEELQNILKGEKDIDAWVVAKMENVSSTLSDITHYLDGKTEYAHGGDIEDENHEHLSGIAYYVLFDDVQDEDEFQKLTENVLTKQEFRKAIYSDKIREFDFDIHIAKSWNIIPAIYDQMEKEGKERGQIIGYDILNQSNAHEKFTSDLPYEDDYENEYEGDEYAKGGKTKMSDRIPTYEIDLIYSDKSSSNADAYYNSSEDIRLYLEKLESELSEKEWYNLLEMGYDFDRIFGMSISYSTFESKIYIPRDEKIKEKIVTFILGTIKPQYNVKFRMVTKRSSDINVNKLAKGGMVGGYSVVLEADDIKNSSFLNYLKRNGIKHEILSVQYQTAEVKFIGSKEALTKMIEKFWVDMEQSEMQEMYDSIQKNEYAKGGIFESDDDDDELDNGEMVNRLPVYEIDLINSVKYKVDNSPIYRRASLDIQQYVSQKLAKRRFGSQDELFAYMGNQIYGVSNSSFSDNWDEESFDIKIIIPRDKKMKQELMTYILEDIKPKYNLQFKVRTKLSTVGKSYHYAKGGNINSKTNKKMATKKVKDGQAAPQTKRWIFAFNKGGYNYYNTKEVPYKKPVDADKKGAPVGYRFSKYAEEKGITNNRFRKPTKSEVEQYAGKKKNGKLIMYRETRSNKSDVNPKKKI